MLQKKKLKKLFQDPSNVRINNPMKERKIGPIKNS